MYSKLLLIFQEALLLRLWSGTVPLICPQYGSPIYVNCVEAWVCFFNAIFGPLFAWKPVILHLKAKFNISENLKGKKMS